ncbi:cytochrome b-c1 complex subunit 7-like protein [Cricetulus griseus]|nr:cytochrome b-c1 complex subunit 7-like protein [Cricetulus griseus]
MTFVIKLVIKKKIPSTSVLEKEGSLSGQDGRQTCSCSVKQVAGRLDGIIALQDSALMRDDTMYQAGDVKEALRRLPENLYNDRMFRINGALDLTLRPQILPKEQWTKYEEDKFHLEPYIKEVIWERREQEERAKK